MRAKLIAIAAVSRFSACYRRLCDRRQWWSIDAAKAQSATARYHDLQVALDVGYTPLPAVVRHKHRRSHERLRGLQSGCGCHGRALHPGLSLLDEVVDAQNPRSARV